MRFGASARRSFVAVLVCSAALGLAACGSDSSDEPSASQKEDVAAITAIADRMNQALVQGKIGKICDLIEADQVKKEFGSEAKCRTRLARSGAKLNQVPNVAFAKITVDGDQAVAQSEAMGEVHFQKSGGKWYVDIAPGNNAPTFANGDQ